MRYVSFNDMMFNIQGLINFVPDTTTVNVQFGLAYN